MTKTQKTTYEQFAANHKHFLWWVKDIHTVDISGMVEATLTWGTIEDKKTLLHILGKSVFKKEFEHIKNGRRAQNLEPRTLSYWSIYLSK
jgi:hypothetical protein